MTAPSEEGVNTALDPLRQMLAADGYDLGLSLGDSTLVVDITATPEACEDCLVPAATIEAIMRSHLQKAGLSVDGLAFDIHHPGGG
jgi:hypothetical protein